jgi:tRNA-splicing ligase RtcB
MGQAVRAHHLARATIRSASMMSIDTDTDAGQAYLNDQDWVRRYASANRLAIGTAVIRLMSDVSKIEPVHSMTIGCDHNHVQREDHFGQTLLVHRKGAMPAGNGVAGVVPRSMGTFSYHVTGRGHPLSLESSAHGAGRLLSRNAARKRFARGDLFQQMKNIWFDPRQADSLREESPKSYKDIRSVMRAQADLVRIDRTLRP